MTLLDGIRVLDLTNVLAGPYAGYQLALMGAEVLKVEIPGHGDLARNLGGDPDLNAKGMGVSFLAQNASKRSLTVNLKHPRGAEVLTRLIRTADALIENFRPGVMARLGFGWEKLQEINPRLVYCAMSGFGQAGSMRERPAYDQIIQGLSGIMSVTGTTDTGPVRTGFPVCDTLGGMAAAFATVTGLVHREQTGAGSCLDVSMLDTALTALGWVVSDYLIAGTQPAPMHNENATAAPSGTFHTSDGDLNIAANTQAQFETLCRVLGREALVSDRRFRTREERKRHREELREELEKTLVQRSAREWDELLQGTGVPSARVLSVPEALELAQVAERALVHTMSVPAASPGKIRLLGSGVHVDGAPLRPSSPPPALGEHTDEELSRIGYSDDEIAELRAEGAV